MISIFNRKELAITFDIKKQAEIRGKLASHNIKYVVILHSGYNLKGNEYIIYVKKSDYDLAKAVIEDKITLNNGGI